VSAAAPGDTTDARALRHAFGAFATGVTVITTVDPDGRWWGLTANSFSSVSLDPPLVMWSQARAAPSHAAFAGAPRFAVHILAESQLETSRRFAATGADKFAGLALRSGLGGVPLLDGCLAVIECTTEAIHPGGDHAVFIGRVARFVRLPGRPLVFADGRYAVAQPHPADA
jgi:flavin reductase (DIM6/NTAB) family NADH-FMN oxidoreductase RutF